MAENSDSTEKTLEPTEKKLKDARKKGDVPSSKETGNMVVVVANARSAAVVVSARMVADAQHAMSAVVVPSASMVTIIDFASCVATFLSASTIECVASKECKR